MAEFKSNTEEENPGKISSEETQENISPEETQAEKLS